MEKQSYYNVSEAIECSAALRESNPEFAQEFDLYKLNFAKSVVAGNDDCGWKRSGIMRSGLKRLDGKIEMYGTFAMSDRNPYIMQVPRKEYYAGIAPDYATAFEIDITKRMNEDVDTYVEFHGYPHSMFTVNQRKYLSIVGLDDLTKLVNRKTIIPQNVTESSFVWLWPMVKRSSARHRPSRGNSLLETLKKIEEVVMWFDCPSLRQALCMFDANMRGLIPSMWSINPGHKSYSDVEEKLSLLYVATHWMNYVPPSTWYSLLQALNTLKDKTEREVISVHCKLSNFTRLMCNPEFDSESRECWYNTVKGVFKEGFIKPSVVQTKRAIPTLVEMSLLSFLSNRVELTAEEAADSMMHIIDLLEKKLFFDETYELPRNHNKKSSINIVLHGQNIPQILADGTWKIGRFDYVETTRIKPMSECRRSSKSIPYIAWLKANVFISRKIFDNLISGSFSVCFSPTLDNIRTMHRDGSLWRYIQACAGCNCKHLASRACEHYHAAICSLMLSYTKYPNFSEVIFVDVYDPQVDFKVNKEIGYIFGERSMFCSEYKDSYKERQWFDFLPARSISGLLIDTKVIIESLKVMENKKISYECSIPKIAYATGETDSLSKTAENDGDEMSVWVFHETKSMKEKINISHWIDTHRLESTIWDHSLTLDYDKTENRDKRMEKWTKDLQESPPLLISEVKLRQKPNKFCLNSTLSWSPCHFKGEEGEYAQNDIFYTSQSDDTMLISLRK